MVVARRIPGTKTPTAVSDVAAAVQRALDEPGMIAILARFY